MNLLKSPIKAIELIKKRNTIAQELKWRGIDWYFSKEGEEAYYNAKTPAQKTMYFFNYLKMVSRNRISSELLYKTAYIMTISMDSSSLDFAGYPNILDPSKNPVVELAKSFSNGDYNFSLTDVAYGLKMLAVFKGEDDSSKFTNSNCKPYDLLTYCDLDANFSDNYIIERNIIGAFCLDFSENCIPPYLYEIIDYPDDDDEYYDEDDDDDDDFLGED